MLRLFTVPFSPAVCVHPHADRAFLTPPPSQAGKLAEAIDGLLPLEKKARMAADVKSTSRILVHIIDMCFEQKNWDMMQEYLVILIKRRGQLKKARQKGARTQTTPFFLAAAVSPPTPPPTPHARP